MNANTTKPDYMHVLILDTEYARAGTEVAFIEWLPGDFVEVELPNGKVVQVPAAAVSAGLASDLH